MPTLIGKVSALNRAYNPNTLAWEAMQQPVINTETLEASLAGISTEAKQDTGNTSLASILTQLQSILAKLNASLAVTITSATPALATVSVLATNTTILASNAARRGATIYNESGALVFVKLGATASLTSYTAQIPVLGYYEVPYGYTGIIDGITAAVTAVTRVTELT